MIGSGYGIGDLPEVACRHILGGGHCHVDTTRFQRFVLRTRGNELRSAPTSAAELEVDVAARAYPLAGYVGRPRRGLTFREEDVGAIGLPHEDPGAGCLEYRFIQQRSRRAGAIEHRAQVDTRIE